MPEFSVGNVVVHDASGEKGVVVELLDDNKARITCGIGKECTASLDAYHVFGDEQ